MTRDGPKICRVTRDWTQIICVTRTGHYNMMRDLLFYKRLTRDLQDLLIGFPW